MFSLKLLQMFLFYSLCHESCKLQSRFKKGNCPSGGLGCYQRDWQLGGPVSSRVVTNQVAAAGTVTNQVAAFGLVTNEVAAAGFVTNRRPDDCQCSTLGYPGGHIVAAQAATAAACQLPHCRNSQRCRQKRPGLADCM